ncbi:chitinase [Mycobacterium sp. NPDC050853]|uniref:glycoside hydrolase family 19 protein n=1 Tax=Mycobacterium sp. NPDC050853 TaxID=3155160 RepID=UPI0033CF61D6
MAATRTNVEFAKRIFTDRVGNDYVYGGNWNPFNLRIGTDCSGLVIDELDAVANGTAMAWSRHGMSTESWRPIEVGQSGTIFNTVCVASPKDFPADAAVKIAIHHGPGGGANSHMWCEVDGIRMESNGSDGCVTGSAARSVYDTTYANDWHYLPGPIVDAAGGGGSGAGVLAEATGLSLARATEILAAVSSGLGQSQCTNVNRIAMWLAQVGHESAGFSATAEHASGDAYDTRTDLGNTPEVDGDGRLYKGRTWIQITGKSNYRQFSQWAYNRALAPTPTYFVDHPLELSNLEYAGVGAAWYWTVARPDINALCDRRDLVTVTYRINGGDNGIDLRRDRYNRAFLLGDRLLQLLTNGDDEFMSALTADEQREVLSLLRVLAKNPYPSRSPLRHLGEGDVDTIAGIGLNEDGNVHVLSVMALARLGDRGALSLLAEVAGAGPVAYPDRQLDAGLARTILADIEATNPAVLQQFINQKGI